MPVFKNTAQNVYNAKKLAKSIENRVTRLRQFNLVLRRAMFGLISGISRVVPVRTGKLFRSMRIRTDRSAQRITIRFTTHYARYPEVRSKLNRYFFRRGLRTGIARANRAQKDFKFGPQRPVVTSHPNGHMSAVVTYHYIDREGPVDYI